MALHNTTTKTSINNNIIIIMSDDHDYTQVPVGQATTIWQAFDKQYINDLVEANLDTFNKEWYQHWFSIHHILTDWGTNPHISISLITNNLTADLVYVVQQLLKQIPFLAADCQILCLVIAVFKSDEHSLSKMYKTGALPR